MISEHIFSSLPQPLESGTSQYPGFSFPQCSSKQSSIVFSEKGMLAHGAPDIGNELPSICTHTHTDTQSFLTYRRSHPDHGWADKAEVCLIMESLPCGGSSWEPVYTLSDKRNGNVCPRCRGTSRDYKGCAFKGLVDCFIAIRSFPICF